VFEPWTCDGQGACVKGTTQDCGNYACDGTAKACKTTCSGDSDCATGSGCNTSTGECAAQSSSCQDAYTVKQANGQVQSCSPYKCVGGGCQQQCTTKSDCAPGYTCTGSVCVAVPDGGSDAGTDAGTGGSTGTGGKSGGGSSDDSGGCGCSVPRRSSDASMLVLGLGLAVLTARRRRPSGRRAA
jgi:MYXO-CTERM domain-containing protein